MSYGPTASRETIYVVEVFEMERMQSTHENLVDYDMSESGIRPVSINDLVATVWSVLNNRFAYFFDAIRHE